MSDGRVAQGKLSGTETVLLGTPRLQTFDSLKASQHRASHSRGTAPNQAHIAPSTLSRPRPGPSDSCVPISAPGSASHSEPWGNAAPGTSSICAGKKLPRVRRQAAGFSPRTRWKGWQFRKTGQNLRERQNRKWKALRKCRARGSRGCSSPSGLTHSPSTPAPRLCRLLPASPHTSQPRPAALLVFLFLPAPQEAALLVDMGFF